MNLYHQELMDHYRNPRHRGVLADYDVATQLHNPSCGDSISWQVKLVDGHLQALAFQGKGCVISQAAASMLACHVIGKTRAQICAMQAADMLALLGIELGPTRIKCALLALEALQSGMQC